jgi:TRAP-type uncharacterized transport system fused permease subunit
MATLFLMPAPGLQKAGGNACFTGNGGLTKAASVTVKTIMTFCIFGGCLEKVFLADVLIMALFRDGAGRTTRNALSA